MWNTALNTVLTAATAALAAVLAAAVGAFGDAGIKLIRRKQEELRLKIGTERYGRDLAFARQAWNVVDEYFRITPNVEKTVCAKQQKFAEEIRKRIPAVTDEEIEQLRQAVAGEVNKGRSALGAESERN